MTNLEWIKKQVADANEDELIEIFDGLTPWCRDTTDDNCDDGCEMCATKWLKALHEKPMPALKVGMFVKANNSYNKTLGIIINNKYANDLAVAYETGGYDPINSVTIEAIYDTVGFDFCDKNTCIWRK